MLRPGGFLALTWNNRDAKIPWVRKLWQLLKDQPRLVQATENSVEALVQSDLFGFVDEKTFHFWQDVNRESLVDLVSSRSYISTLDDEAREAKLAQVLAFYDDYGRGMDGMQLPYNCECFRAQVVDPPDQPHPEDSDDAGDDADPPTDDDPGDGRRVSDGTDTDMLLIDFR